MGISIFFVLRGSTLLYFSHSTDTESKGRYYLKKNCRVSPIREEEYKRKKQYVFSLICPVEGSSSSGGQKDSSEASRESKSEGGGTGGRSSTKLDRDSTLMSWIMGSDKGSVEMKEIPQTIKEVKEREVVLAADTAYDAHGWVLALENQIASMSPPPGSGFFGIVDQGVPKDGNRRHPGTGQLAVESSRIGTFGGASKAAPAMRLKDVNDWVKRSKWTVADTRNGIRYYHKDGHSPMDPACARINITIAGSSTEVLKEVLSMPALCQNGPVEKIRLVERLESYVDIVHITCREMELQPSMVASRDFCVLRYWKQMSDGSYVVCLDSTFHPDCPIVPGRVRGELHAAYVISPPKDAVDEAIGDNETDFGSAVGTQRDECLLSFVCSMNPKGWMWKKYHYMYLYNFLSHVLDIRDAINMDKFSRFRFDPDENDDEMTQALELESDHRGVSTKGAGGRDGEQSVQESKLEKVPSVCTTRRLPYVHRTCSVNLRVNPSCFVVPRT